MPIDPNTKRSDLDVLSKSPKASWRGIEFPCGASSFAFEQALALHTYPDRDAGYIESTGRNPAIFQFTAIFRNGIAGESLLFPITWQAFMRACLDRTAGELGHPLLGKLRAKCRSHRTVVDPNRRDGVDVEVEFIEATDEEDELSVLLGQNSPLGACVAAARNLDAGLVNVSPVPTLPERLKPSLLDSINQLSGLIAQFKLGIGNIVGQIDGYASAVDQLTEQIKSIDDPKNYQVLNACEQLFASLLRLSEEVVKKSRPFFPAVVPFETNLAGAAAFFKMSVADFVSLNPLIASRETVRAGTAVFVYA